MKILAIETSCDETAAAVIENGTKIISNIVASSMEIHEKTGGIIPEIAAREQVKCIIPVINEAIGPFAPTQDKQIMNNIDAIAVTVGPGLNGSLLIGVETAKTIAFVTKKPIIPVNHIFAHLYANWLGTPNIPHFPTVALVVSGGHTELFLMHNHKKITWLGGTRDDAAGEAFDKTARLLDLGFPGGPAIAAEAVKFKIQNSKFKITLPRPMIGSDTLEFSFSGLKTAVMREINKFKSENQWNNKLKEQLAFEIQESITAVLVRKTLDAAKKHDAKSIVLGGGVAANKRLSEKFQSAISNQQLAISLHIPPSSLCTDNAAYIGSFAYFHPQTIPWQQIQAKPDLTVEV